MILHGVLGFWGAPELLFLPMPAGARTLPRLCTYHAPRGVRCAGLVVYVHPFGDEMNKSRRMAALQSRAMAEEGFAVAQIDLLGCGDSGGDFEDASWAIWVDDVVATCRWLRSRHGDRALPLWLWGLRAGNLITAQAAEQLDTAVKLLCWCPVTSGTTALQQFLRLQVASRVTGGGEGPGTETLRRCLAGGQTVDVAGYRLAPALAMPLQEARLTPPSNLDRSIWLELNARAPLQHSPGFLKAAAQWTDAGCKLVTGVVQGPSFWQTVETEDAPALIAATIDAMQTHLKTTPRAAACEIGPTA